MITGIGLADCSLQENNLSFTISPRSSRRGLLQFVCIYARRSRSYILWVNKLLKHALFWTSTRCRPEHMACNVPCLLILLYFTFDCWVANCEAQLIKNPSSNLCGWGSNKAIRQPDRQRVLTHQTIGVNNSSDYHQMDQKKHGMRFSPFFQPCLSRNFSLSYQRAVQGGCTSVFIWVAAMVGQRNLGSMTPGIIVIVIIIIIIVVIIVIIDVIVIIVIIVIAVIIIIIIIIIINPHHTSIMISVIVVIANVIAAIGIVIIILLAFFHLQINTKD